MGHPLITEFARASHLQTHFFRRCQREFPQIVDHLETERDTLRLQLVEAQAQVTALETELARVTALAKRRGAAA
jgi:hypothetical protein